MTRKTVGLASVLVIASILAAALVAGSMLPEAMQLPVHWGLSGEADGFADKWTALLAPAGMTAAVSLLFYFLPAIEPRREGLNRSQGLYLWGWIAILMMGGVIELVVLSHAFGWNLPVVHLIVGAVGLMLALIGNQLGKSRSMYLMGVRTPWTLASEEVWIRTHRLCGKLMVGGGAIMAIAALLALPPEVLMAVTFAVVAISAGVPILYSFILWRREQADQASG
jgi:uncharacterized membrane protein